MYKIIVPDKHSSSFLNFIRDRESEFISIGRNTRDGFHYIKWDNEYFTAKTMAELYNEFLVFIGDSPIEDGGVFLDEQTVFMYDKGFIFKKGNYTARASYLPKEEIWRKEFLAALKEIDISTLICVDLNSSTNTMFKYVPTVSITPYYQLGCQGSLPSSNKKISISFNGAVFPASINNLFDGERLYTSKDYPELRIQTSFCTIYRNADGMGNHVFINADVFNNDSIDGVPSIYELLKQPIFWEKILVPFCITPFDTLKDSIENAELSIEEQVEALKTLIEHSTRVELQDAIYKRNQIKIDIENLISSITTKKISESNLEQQIAEKQAILDKKPNKSQLIKDLEAIKSLPYITNMRITPKGSLFVTNPIQIDSGPLLGGYRIEYKSDTKRLTVKNPVNPITDKSGYILAHPHCPQGETPCFGNYTDILYNFEIGNYLIALELMYKFLSTYNPEDVWGRRLIYWDAKYTFEDILERGLKSYIEPDYRQQYLDVYGEALYQDEEICPTCGDSWDDCECERCERCDELLENCCCDRCPICNGLVDSGYNDSCECDRCDNCNALLRDCECERCEHCGEIIDYCTCEICTECGLCIHDCECERCLMDNEQLLINCDCGDCSNICVNNTNLEEAI